MRDTDVVVIGAGVVGLACAAELAKHGFFVTVLERHARVAEEGSSRNSGVIHSGLYYPTGTLKQRLCVRGRELLYARARRFGLPHRKLGKLIVARDSVEARTLEVLHARATDNGAGSTRLVDGIALAMLEETVRGYSGLLVEEAGVLRVREFVRSLVREAEALRVELIVGMEVTALERDAKGGRDRWTVRVQGTSAGEGFRCEHVVDACGLAADHVARLAGIDTDRHGLTQRFCKGTWLALDERFRKGVGRLLYPTPDLAHAAAAPTALGIHLTRDLDGFLIAGPDAEWGPTPDLALDGAPERAERYSAAISHFLPGVGPRDLVPLGVGVRPKLHGPGEPAADFVIRDCTAMGAPRFVLLAGIESPGLTAALAIAEEVRAIIVERS